MKLGNTADVGADAIRKVVVNICTAASVVSVESTVGTHPQLSLLIAKDASYAAVVDGGVVIVVVKHLLKAIAVKFVYSIVSAYPYKSVIVLTQIRD